MLDRESTFADPEIVKMLKKDFIAVAIDQAYQRRQQDAEGEFYRKIAGQSPRSDFRQTTQGMYTLTPDGTLLGYNNNRGPERVSQMMKTALDDYEPSQAEGIATGEQDVRYNPQIPAGGLVVRVRAKILDGYPPTDDRWKQIFNTAVSRDNLWITADEHQALAAGQVPELLQERLARFHLVDNTRGEPPMWREGEIKNVRMVIDKGVVRGSYELATENGERTFRGEMFGFVETENGKVTRLDFVAKGLFEGEGRYTRGAPEGEFPLAISFTLADGSDVADSIPPQGSRGWIDGYLK